MKLKIQISKTVCFFTLMMGLSEPVKARVEFSQKASFDFGGEISAVQAADLDADGNTDLAFFSAQENKVKLLVAWGTRTRNSWSKSTEVQSFSSTHKEARDTSSRVIGVPDLNHDGRLDVLVASGMALQTAPRKFRWESFPEDASGLLNPVAARAVADSAYQIVRGLSGGAIQMLNVVKGKTKDEIFLGKLEGECVSDLALNDFDQDGSADLLAGCEYAGFGEKPFSIFWQEKENWKHSKRVAGIGSADWAIGDIDGDGSPDLIAQFLGPMGDFPDKSQVWFSKKGIGLVAGEVFTNAYNHADRSTIADVDGNGCNDLLQIGVDVESVAVWFGHKKNGRCEIDFTKAPGSPGSKNLEIPASSGIGVQVVRINKANFLLIQTKGIFGGRLKIYSVDKVN